ncbi:hypothetical protein SESBI_48973 [Sesbania bispinosa]|nr:hypothetical protein SESBI_48973 [Sesbania bispinosa]
MENPTPDEAKNGDFCKGAKLRRMKRVIILIKTIEILKAKIALIRWKCEVNRKKLQLLEIENQMLKSALLEAEQLSKLKRAEKQRLIELQRINWVSEPSDGQVIDKEPYQG